MACNQGANLQDRSICAGIGYFRQSKDDVLGFALNWGRPNVKTFGADLGKQFTAEPYYHIKWFKHVAITPDIQLVINPALNPDQHSIWVFGLRSRISF